MSTNRYPTSGIQDTEHSIPCELPPVNPASYLQPGALICDRYRVICELGKGGMGMVYKCFDEIASIETAIKTIAPELSGSQWEMEMVKRNFQLVYKLNHSNIAAYRNLERDPVSGLYYLVMEYVDGEDLRYYLRRKLQSGELSSGLVCSLIKDVAAALDYAHGEKILHRDIKPANIMVDKNDRVKLMDFGLAAEIHSSLSRVSMTRIDTSGTLPYIAPEQWRGQVQTAAADQYALGVMAYEIFSGNLPFNATDVNIMRSCVLNEQPAPIEGVAPSINAAVLKALSKTPAERFASCGEFAAALLPQTAAAAPTASATRLKLVHSAGNAAAMPAAPAAPSAPSAPSGRTWDDPALAEERAELLRTLRLPAIIIALLIALTIIIVSAINSFFNKAKQNNPVDILHEITTDFSKFADISPRIDKKAEAEETGEEEAEDEEDEEEDATADTVYVDDNESDTTFNNPALKRIYQNLPRRRGH